MKRIKKAFLSAGIMALMVLGSQLYMYASSANDVVINLPTTSSAYTYKYVTRSLNYSYVSVHADSVYPTNGGADTYTYFKSKLFTMDTMGSLSNVYSVYETNLGFTKHYLFEGTLGTSQLYIGFNNPYNGYNVSTVVDYNGN